MSKSDNSLCIKNMIVPKVRNMPPSGIRKYFDLINEMKEAISLGIGEPDFVTPWRIREAGIYSLEEGHTHYSPNSGYMELRQEISNYMKRRHELSYDPKNQIIVTVGGSEGIDLTLRALVEEGDEVILPEPSFVAYKACITLTGATVVSVPLDPSNGFKLTSEQLENAITPRTKVLILPYPNNPTGGIMGREDLDSIYEVLKDKNIFVLSDEIYSELTYSGKHISIATYPGMKDKTIVINGFSKAYAMTGWRLGYLCAHEDLINAVFKIHQYAIMSSPTTAQYAAIEALRNSDAEVGEMVNEYNRRRRLMVKGFREAGYDCFEPQGAFYVFPCIKSSGLTSDQFCDKLLEEEKVLVIPGNAFGPCGEGFIRACYASSMEKIIEAMKRIKRFSDKPGGQ